MHYFIVAKPWWPELDNINNAAPQQYRDMKSKCGECFLLDGATLIILKCW